jgi:hypothetical protein
VVNHNLGLRGGRAERKVGIVSWQKEILDSPTHFGVVFRVVAGKIPLRSSNRYYAIDFDSSSDFAGGG